MALVCYEYKYPLAEVRAMPLPDLYELLAYLQYRVECMKNARR